MSKGTAITVGSSSSGGGGGITIGTTTITGGNSTEVLFNLGGVVSSDPDMTFIADTLTVTKFVSGNGTITIPSIRFAAATDAGLYSRSAGFVSFTASSIGQGEIFNGGFRVIGTNYIGWTSGDITTATDTAFRRDAAGIISPSLDGTTSNGWIKNGGGEAALNANYTNATASFTATTLSRTLISGRTYNFEVNLFISESTAADGWQIDFNGGSAAMTNFVAHANSIAETGIIVVLANATSAALATVINATSTVTTGGQVIRVVGSFVPSGNGTFILRAAQNTHSTGTLTIKRGSSLIIRDTPAL